MRDQGWLSSVAARTSPIGRPERENGDIEALSPAWSWTVIIFLSGGCVMSHRGWEMMQRWRATSSLAERPANSGFSGVL
jgi:hypothetical protein